MVKTKDPDKLIKKDAYLQAMKGYLEIGDYGIKANTTKQKGDAYELLDYLKKDPLIRSCMKIRLNSIFKRGFIVDDVPKGKLKHKESFIKDARAEQSLKKSVFQLLLYANSFNEIVKTVGGKLVRLPTLSAPSMEIKHDKQGGIEKYYQFLTADMQVRQQISRARKEDRDLSTFIGKGYLVEFQKEDIFFMSTNHIDSSVWGFSDIETLKRYIEQKHRIEDFIEWLFASNQFRTVIKLDSNQSDKQIKEYLQLLVNSMNDPTKFLILKGEMAEHKPLREISGFGELLQVLAYYKAEIISLCQITPIQVSQVDGSNRSSSDTQYRYVNNDDTRALQRVIEDEVNYQLFPLIGLDGAEFKFKPLDDKSENDYLDMAQKFMNMGANPKKINDWLIDKGFDIPDDLLEKPEPMLKPSNGNNLSLDKNSSLHPSRKPSKVQFEDLGASQNL